ncbi:MAG: ABC transporter substrate-binding protein [Flavobacteriaceae bacterium]|nr:ABC transporter substrate-binding protein [Flavobacteriaceae bacterium]
MIIILKYRKLATKLIPFQKLFLQKIMRENNFHALNNHLKYLFIFLALSLWNLSCKEVNNKTIKNTNSISFLSSIKYAKGFDIQIFDGYKKLIIKSPYPDAKNAQEFILISKNSSLKEQFSEQNIIIIPLKKIVATSTTHIPMLELIGEENSLIGFPHTDYISSSKTRNLIKNGNIKEIGNEQDINTEILINLQPDAVIGFSMGNSSKMYNTIEKNGISVIYNSEWLEKTPLGRTEWIKFFGALFDKDKLADSIFQDIENKYNTAKNIAKKTKKKPSVLTGILFKDKWNLPAGESFMAQLLEDANTNYLWSETKGQGSLILSFESVFEKAKTANFWIGSGYYTSLEDLANANKHYTKFETFKNKQIYTFSKKRSENGGVLYFELAPVQPHIVLQDLIKIMHPELLTSYQPFFLEKLN